VGPRANPDAFGNKKNSWEMNFHNNITKLLDNLKKPQQHLHHIKEWTARPLSDLIIHSILNNNILENYKMSFNANLIPLSIHPYNIKIREDVSQNTDTVITL
jgi:hypothetical protein